jgi:serine/threonine protein kinase
MSSLAEDIAPAFEDTPYSIQIRLGAGSMGDVYLAQHKRLKRHVVVKVLKAHLGAGIKDRFRLEAQALAKLRHDHIVDVIDCGDLPDTRPYLVMEHLEGASLDKLLEEHGTLPVARALAITRDILAGLGHAHALGIIHRDIKPANVFVCVSGRVKVLDFGVAKITEALADVAPLRLPTAEGIMVGTPRYMSPEQARGRPIDGRSDLYATGLVLYGMLAGTEPFLDECYEVADLLRARVQRPIVPPSKCAPQPVDPALDRFVLRAIAPQPENRFQSAFEMAGELFKLTPDYRRIAEQFGFDEVDWSGPTPAEGHAAAAAPQSTIALTNPHAPFSSTIADANVPYSTPPPTAEPSTAKVASSLGAPSMPVPLVQRAPESAQPITGMNPSPLADFQPRPLASRPPSLHPIVRPGHRGDAPHPGPLASAPPTPLPSMPAPENEPPGGLLAEPEVRGAFWRSLVVAFLATGALAAVFQLMV